MNAFYTSLLMIFLTTTTTTTTTTITLSHPNTTTTTTTTTTMDDNNETNLTTTVNTSNDSLSVLKINRIKFACVVDKSTVVKVRHGPIPGYTSNWSVHDLLSAQPIYHQLMSVFESNSTFVLSNSSELQRDFAFGLSNKQSWMVHRINLDRFRAQTGGKELVFARYANATRQTTHFAIETIALDNRTDCSIYHPLRQPESNVTTGDFDTIKLVRMRKNQTVRLYCSIMLRAADLEGDEQSRPMIKWVVEKPSKIGHVSFASPSSSFAKLVSNRTGSSSNQSSSSYNYVYWTHIDYTPPLDDLNAWQHHDEPIVCHVGHNHFYDGAGGSAQTHGIYYTISRNISRIPHLGCKIKLNIQFEPFVHPDVAREQTLREIDRTGLVECPIKANSHFPFKYMISWSTYSRVNKQWTVKHQQELVNGADFYMIENLRYRDHNEALFKCQLYEIDLYFHHPPVDHHKKPIYKFNREDTKKFKFLLESTVLVRVVPRDAIVELDAEMPIECEPAMVWSPSLYHWMAYLALCLIFSFCVHFFIQFVKSQIKRHQRLCRTETSSGTAVRFNEYRFDSIAGEQVASALSPHDSGNFKLNTVSSVELIRKSKRVKCSSRNLDKSTDKETS